MDQNSSNGSGPDKRNWRERLGIGAKEIPKLADEFREEPAAEEATEEGAEAAKPASRPAQPVVTKPAPMAPRVAVRAPAPAAPRAPAAPPPAPRAAAPAAPAQAPAAPAVAAARVPRVSDNATQEALAEKLRAQRAAAEKLAEQRVQAARERAEGKAPAAPAEAARPAAPITRNPAPPLAPRPRPPVAPPPAPAARPKFSFAEDQPRGAGETPARPGLSNGAPAPLAPPRPSLGGDRGQPPFLRPSPAGLGARPQPTYRPVDPAASGSYAPAPRLQAPAARPSYGEAPPAPSYPAPRSGARRPPALDPYARAPESRDVFESEADEARQPPRLGRPAPSAAPRARAPQEDMDEVFEDEAAARPRASARDYQAAYRDGDDVFGDEPRRSKAPLVLIIALAVAALLTAGVVWYLNGGMSNVASTGGSTGTEPIVAAPESPAKVAPEVPAAGTDAPAAQKKQIYDRIVGEQEVGGQMQPTEETPVPPGDGQQPADEVKAIEPASGANAIPAPDATDQGTGAEPGLPSVDEPLPLPPPPPGQEGNLGQKATQQVAAVTAPPEQGATAPPAPPAPPSAPTTSSAAVPMPPPEATDGAALVSAAAETPDPVESTPPAKPQAVAAAEPEPEPQAEAAATTPKKKPATPKKKPAEPAMENLGAEPVVLVPPAKVVPEETQIASSTPVTTPDTQAANKKKRSIMDLFRNSDGTTAAAGTETTSAAPQTATRVVSAEPQQPAAKAQATSPATGGGYMVQLASFRSESDARQEYARLTSLYPSVIGALPRRISQTTVGGSMRYQLGLGPMPSRSEATRVCGELITAGESDCIVRGP